MCITHSLLPVCSLPTLGFLSSSPPTSRITCLESQLEKQATELSKKDIELARERGICKELEDENARLQTSQNDYHTELRALGDTNDVLRIEISMKENAISNLEGELATLREDFADREQTFISKVSSLDQSTSDLRIQLEEAQSETNSQSVLLSQIKEEMRVAKEGETMAKERLIKTEKECAEKISSTIRREADAIDAATSDLNARLQLAEERARVAEEREKSANAIRRKAEIETTGLRTAAEKQLCQTKQQIRREYEILLQSKDDELVATNKLREADALQMEYLRHTLATQASNHKSELERHTEKIQQLSSDLHQAREDLDSERKASSELRIDLGTAQARLDGATRKYQEDERAWEQEKSLLEDEVSILKEEMDMQKETNGEEVASYVEKIRRGREREAELERRLVDDKKQYQVDRELLMKKAEDALRNIFTAG